MKSKMMLVLTILGVSAGCGSESKENKTQDKNDIAAVVVCDAREQYGICAIGKNMSREDAQAACPVPLAEGECPAENRVAICRATDQEAHYYKPEYDEAKSKSQCDGAGGTLEIASEE